MDYKKQTKADWDKRLAELRKSAKRPFGSKLEAIRVSFDLSVIGKHKPA